MISKNDVYKVVVLLFFSLFSITAGIITDKVNLILFGIILGSLGYILRMRDLRCPHCEKHLIMSDILSAEGGKGKKVRCPHCTRMIIIEK